MKVPCDAEDRPVNQEESGGVGADHFLPLTSSRTPNQLASHSSRYPAFNEEIISYIKCFTFWVLAGESCREIAVSPRTTSVILSVRIWPPEV